ncbi:major facilitator superfamily permease [Latilactobacillus curvatus]|uniref:hypothetical protein n=1 Tax=Latilactobacillus curvatus TaxID=28038 RepID=UPI00057584E3|nr:hypothetical protein [Latilactobacillus curvatus]KHO13300.1 major facilitator superfamily permease [Latilactobacillus curvatus]
MIKIDGFVLLLAFITVGGLCYGAGQIGFKNLWGFDDDQSDSNVIKFIDGRYVRPNRKAQ